MTSDGGQWESPLQETELPRVWDTHKRELDIGGGASVSVGFPLAVGAFQGKGLAGLCNMYKK